MGTPDYAVRVRDVRVTYPRGNVEALRGVTLDVALGERVCLLGPNGAGKSTLTHVMLGLLRPDTGSVGVLGATPRGALAAGGVGAMLQETGLMRDIRVGELVRLVTGLYGARRAAGEVLAEVGLEDLARRPVTALSGGQRQRLKLALALSGKPSLLFLDEPTVALDVAARRSFWTVLTERANAGVTVLFTTHYLEEAEQFADRVIVLRDGSLVADGTVREVRSGASGSRISFSTNVPVDPAVLSRLPGVRAVSARGGGYTLTTSDSDLTLPALYQNVDGVHDLSVVSASLEDAVVGLLGKEAS